MAAVISGPMMIAVGAIVAALLAGSFSYLNLITAKEQKVSEFRQQWIDALRASMSEYIAALAYLSILYRYHLGDGDDQNNDSATVNPAEETHARINKSYNDIIFRINPCDKDKVGKKLNDHFLTALNHTQGLYNERKYMSAVDSCKDVRAAGTPLLKFEWERVKGGEPSYIEAKKVARLVLRVGLTAALLLVAYVIYAAVTSPPVTVASPALAAPKTP